MVKKKIVFVTGTRADYGKLKSIIKTLQQNKNFNNKIFVTGMHNLVAYGNTYSELVKDKIRNIFRFKNQEPNDSMDLIVSKTIIGFSRFLKKINPDLIVIHGDRIETLACAIVGSLNNVLVAHIEGGEVSGTIDEILRHSISKLSNFHFVSNKKAKQRLIQMGELSRNIYVIGSPDIDLMSSKYVPSLKIAKERYKVSFDEYAILLFHPVVSKQERKTLKQNCKLLVNLVKKSSFNFIVIYPNNDLGSNIILKQYKTLKGKKNIKIFSSLRFEYFLSFLRGANFIIGNSSAGVREAPYYGTPTINLGSRQYRRSISKTIYNIEFKEKKIKELMDRFIKTKIKLKKFKEFGAGNSNKKFIKIISNGFFWKTSNQKYFKDYNI